MSIKTQFNRPFLFLRFSFILLFFVQTRPLAFSSIPRPDHVVICILENHAYSQIIGNPAAPYINQLVFKSANLMEFYALTHPSQPNYIMLFSGSNQGETTNNVPAGTPWTTPNLGGSLLNAGFTFESFSENLPSVGSTVATSGAYARKHCPWVNWQGSGTNQIPASCNKTMLEFPTDFNNLPDLSFVIPDQNNDMHNGSDPARITRGDLWVHDKLDAYVQWAEQNNSLFILTFDEDNITPVNKIMCLFIGPMVRQGNYYLKDYNLYDLLHTLEDMYGLPYAGNSINSQSIREIWMLPTDISTISAETITAYVYPNPMTEYSMISIDNNGESNDQEVHIKIYDMSGRVVDDEIISMFPGRNNYAFRKEGLTSGIYSFLVGNERDIIGSGKFIVN